MKTLFLRRQEALQALQDAKKEAYNTKCLIDDALEVTVRQAIFDGIESENPQACLKLSLSALCYCGATPIEKMARKQQELNTKLTELLDQVDRGRTSIFFALKRSDMLTPQFISGHKTITKTAILRGYAK